MIELRNVSVLELLAHKKLTKKNDIYYQIPKYFKPIIEYTDPLIFNNYSKIYGEKGDYLDSLKATANRLSPINGHVHTDGNIIREKLLQELSLFEDSFKEYLENRIKSHDEKLEKYLDNEEQCIPYGIKTFFILNYLYIVTENVNATSGKFLAEIIEEKPKNSSIQYTFKNEATELFRRKIISSSDIDFEPNILTFNYTNFSDFLKTEARHIHRSLSNSKQGTSIIFGIDYDKLEKNFNIKDENNDEIDTYLPIEFTKSFRILKSSEKTTNIMNREIDFIKFYGYGLGEADYSYFQSIFDMVDLYQGETTLIFFWSRHSKEDGDQTQIKQFNQVTKLISEYGKTFSNKDHGKNLLTKLQMEGRLKLAEIPVHEIFDNIKWK